MRYKLLFAGAAAMGLMLLMFSTLLFAVEGNLELMPFIFILLLAICTIVMGIVFFFAGDDAMRLAAYNFFKKKGGGFILEGYEDFTAKWGFHTKLPKKVEFETKQGQDEPEWAEATPRTKWHVRGSGVPIYFFFRGIPQNIDPFTDSPAVDSAGIINKVIIQTSLQSKIESMRQFLKDIGTDPKVIYMLLGAIILTLLVGIVSWNCFQVLAALAEKQGISVAEYTFLMG